MAVKYAFGSNRKLSGILARIRKKKQSVKLKRAARKQVAATDGGGRDGRFI